jgi:glycosyltransferase involved in cell wall biosynthesis
MNALKADLVVFSHLRWDWVWQRPQHLISRLAQGRRTLFVEMPCRADVTSPVVRRTAAGSVERMWVDIPQDSEIQEFGEGAPPLYLPFLTDYLADNERDVWLYAPTAVEMAEALDPRLLIYDVMDDLSSFADAPPEMQLRTRRALTIADVAFAGGRSLHRSAAAVRGPDPTHLFPSGVEYEHFARARELRAEKPRKTVGYVGVIDERLDLDLLRGMAEQLPDWDVQMVGPTTKIDPATLPRATNISYLGMQAYAHLPEVMAGLDVALMPFALNAATRSISPTKTLEYLAAGLPVVSTRVPDVVADWSGVVHLADDHVQFADACRQVSEHSVEVRDQRASPLRHRHEWDNIAAGMVKILDAAVDEKGAEADPQRATA